MENKGYSGPAPEKIQTMFASVAKGYDRANQVLSLGIHHLWRNRVVNLAAPGPGFKILDCATGTGDLAIALQNRCQNKAEVIGLDFCAEMLESAPAKANRLGLKIDFQVGDVTALNFQENAFDLVTISFGIRNVHDPVQGLKEMARVIKPGGRLIVLEFGQPSLPIFKQLYNFYSNNVLPQLGGAITGDTQAYQYLQNSSAQFPCREDFLKWMESTGQLKDCKYNTLTGGIAYIYSAQKK